MAATLAENLNEKIGAAVDHGRMVAELWHRVDHSKDFPMRITRSRSPSASRMTEIMTIPEMRARR